MAESDLESWKEVRARADSLASAIFLIAGGALSVSIAVLLGKDATRIPPAVKPFVFTSWGLLLYSMFAFIAVKGLLIVQSHKMLGPEQLKDEWLRETAWANWFLGVTGVIAFFVGMSLLLVT